jgi:hypothetical protein
LKGLLASFKEPPGWKREREKREGGGIEPGHVVKKEKIMCNLSFGVKFWADQENNSGIGLFRNFNFMGSLKLIRATQRWWWCRISCDLIQNNQCNLNKGRENYFFKPTLGTEE